MSIDWRQELTVLLNPFPSVGIDEKPHEMVVQQETPSDQQALILAMLRKGDPAAAA